MLAVGRKDADQAMKTNWRGGKFLVEIRQGKVKADCGDITEAARLEVVFKSREEYVSDGRLGEEVGDDDER